MIASAVAYYSLIGGTSAGPTPVHTPKEVR